MRRAAYLVRFFFVVPPVPPVMVAAVVASAMVGMLALVRDADGTQRALAPLFLLQACAASSGMAGPARRGHYDMLLTSGAGRLAIGLVHCGMSIAPGVLAWVAIAVFEAVVRGSSAVPSLSAGTMLSAGTIVALLAVSITAWAITAPFPRLTGALVWLAVLAGAWAVLPAVVWDGSGGAVLCPWHLVGRSLSHADVLPVAVLLVAAATGLAASLVWFNRMNVGLEAPP